MKKLMFMLLILGSIQGVYAQRTEKSKKFMVDKTLFEELTDVKKKSDKFNLYLNMQGGFRCKLQRRIRRRGFQNEAATYRNERKHQQLALLPLSPTLEPFQRRRRND